MEVYKNINTGIVRVFNNIEDTPRLYAETIALTSANKDLKPEEIEWEVGTEADLPKRPSFEPPTQEQLAVEQRKAEIKARLGQLSEDIIQDQAGEFVPNIADRKAEFMRLHNELRTLEGKEPRILK